MVFVRLEVLYASCQYNLRRWVRLVFSVGGDAFCTLLYVQIAIRLTIYYFFYLLTILLNRPGVEVHVLGLPLKAIHQILVSALGKHSSIRLVEVLRFNAFPMGCDAVNLAQSFI